MKTISLKPLLIWTGLLGVGVLLGRWSVRSEVGEGSVSTSKSSVAKALVSPAGSGTQGNATKVINPNSVDQDEAWLASLEGPDRAKAMGDKAKEVLFEKNPARRLMLFSSVLSHMKEGEYEQVVSAFRFHDQEGRLFPQEYDLFCATAGMVDGKNTMDSIFKWFNIEGRRLYGAQEGAMAAWASAEPSKAIAWWNELPEGQLRDDFAKSLLRGVATKDVNQAWNCMNVFPVEERAKFMGTLVRQQISDGGVEAASTWLANLTSSDGADVSQLRQKGFESLFNAMPNFSSDRKAQYVSQFMSEPWMASSTYPMNVAKEWAVQSGSQAAAWAAQLPANIQEQALPSALASWFQREPEAATQWLKANQGDAAVADHAKRVEQLLGAKSQDLAKNWNATMGVR